MAAVVCLVPAQWVKEAVVFQEASHLFQEVSHLTVETKERQGRFLKVAASLIVDFPADRRDRLAARILKGHLEIMAASVAIKVVSVATQQVVGGLLQVAMILGVKVARMAVVGHLLEAAASTEPNPDEAATPVQTATILDGEVAPQAIIILAEVTPRSQGLEKRAMLNCSESCGTWASRLQMVTRWQTS